MGGRDLHRGTLGALLTLLALSASACLFGLELPGDEGRPCGPGNTCLYGDRCVDGLCMESSIGDFCDVTDDTCEEGFCWMSSDADEFCTITCSATSDCPGGYRCSDGDAALSGAWLCLPDSVLGSVGETGRGSACLGDDDCQSGLCQGGLCVDTCQNQGDCGDDEVLECQIERISTSSEAFCLPAPISGAAQGQACAESSECARGNCIDDGAGGGLCADPCCSSADCPPGDICWVVLDPNWSPGEGLARSCYGIGTGDANSFGEACAGDYDCQSAVCLIDPHSGNRGCSDTCCGDEDCPVGYRCEPVLYDVDDDGTPESYLPFCVTRP